MTQVPSIKQQKAYWISWESAIR